MSAFGGKADMTVCGSPLSRSLLGVERTFFAQSAGPQSFLAFFEAGKNEGGKRRGKHFSRADAFITYLFLRLPGLRPPCAPAGLSSATLQFGEVP